MQVTCATEEAYKTAKENWTKQADLVLITYIPNCGLSDEDQRAFWKTKSLKFDDGTHVILVTAQEISLKESVSEMDLEWGKSLVIEQVVLG